MKWKVVVMPLLLAGLLEIRSGSAHAQECKDINQAIITSITEKFPCPASADKLRNFLNRVNARLSQAQNAAKQINRSVRVRNLVDINLITTQILDYAAACSESLGGIPTVPNPDPEPTPDPGNPETPNNGGLSNVCASSSPIAMGELLIKSEISNHINGGDPRATGYTLVCARQCPANLRKTDFFYSDGSYAGSVGYYGTFSGNGRPRLYGAAGGAPQHFVREIAPRAASIGNGKLYMQMSSALTGPTTSCKEFNPTGRNGGL